MMMLRLVDVVVLHSIQCSVFETRLCMGGTMQSVIFLLL